MKVVVCIVSALSFFSRRRAVLKLHKHEIILNFFLPYAEMFKVEYLGRIEYDFQKSGVTGPWDHKDSVSAKKVFKKISCLFTFKGIEMER
jgi:hypothetical protein